MSKEDFWIDFIEGELEPSVQRGAKKVLLSSPEDRNLIEDLTELKEELRMKDEMRSLEVKDDFFEEMHSRIMDQVAQESLAPPPTKWQRWRRSHRRWAMAGTTVSLSVMVLFGVFWAYQQRQAKMHEEYAFAVEVLLESKDHGPTALLMTGHQIDQDLWVDYAHENFEGLSLQQVEGLVGTL